MFLDYIKNVRNSQDYIYDDIKAINLPVVIYGASAMGIQIARLLRQHGIEPMAYAVDHAYYSSSRLFDGAQIWDFSLLRKYSDKIAVVLAIGAESVVRSFLSDRSLKKFVFPALYGKIAPIDYDFIRNNQEKFQETYDCLADELSKKTMLAYLNLKISGDITWNIDVYRDEPEYFINDLLQAPEDGVYVDCGAYRGDTIEGFINWCHGNYTQIYAMESEPLNVAALRLYTEINGWHDVEIIPKATWDKDEKLFFNMEGVYGAAVSNDKGQFEVEGCPIDTILHGSKVDFIKMDIEGAELNALRGAEKSIRRYRPGLAVCAYHRTDDLITLPQYIHSLGGYRLYLRKYGLTHEYDLVLYAVPEGE